MKETKVIGNYEKKSLIDRIKELFAKSEPRMLGFGEDEYIDMEVRSMMDERNGVSPIQDPKKEEKFRAEMTKTIKALLAKMKAEKDPEAKEAPGKEDEAADAKKAGTSKTSDEKEKEIKEKKKDIASSKKRTARDINSKNIGYLDRLELLSQLKTQMYEEQIRRGADVPDDKDYYKMLLLQKSIEKDRKKYIKGLDKKGKKELQKVEEGYMSKELEQDRKANAKFRQDLSELQRLNEKLNDINEWIEFKQREMREGLVDPDEYSKGLQAKQTEMTDTLIRIEKLNPNRLQQICDSKAKHAKMERVIMGPGYRTQVYKRSSDEMKERLDYRSGKEKQQAFGTKAQNKFFRNNLQEMIDQHKKHKEELEKELDKLGKGPEDLERRAEVIKELCITTVKLHGYEENQDRVESTGEQDKAELFEDSKEVKEEIERIEEHFDEIDKKIDVAVPEAPVASDREQIKNTIITAAVIGGAAAVMDDAHEIEGNPTEPRKAPIAKEKVSPVRPLEKDAKPKGMLGEWQNAVNDTFDENAIDAQVAREEALKELDERENGEMVRTLPNT